MLISLPSNGILGHVANYSLSLTSAMRTMNVLNSCILQYDKSWGLLDKYLNI